MAALHGAMAGDAGDHRIVGEECNHLIGDPHAVVQQHDGHSCRQLPDQRSEGRYHLPRFGHHQQAFDAARLVDEGAFDGQELGMPLKGGKVDAGVQGGTMALAQQEAGCLAALGQQGGEDAAQAPQPSKVHSGETG